MNTSGLQQTYKPGAICIIEEEGRYGIIKVLVIDADEAHVKIYSNKYDHFPEQTDISSLSLKAHEDGSFGISHIPLERQGFDNWKPVVVAFEPVSDEELQGYRIWRGE